MGNDISTDRFLWVRIEHGRTTIHLRNNLVRNHHRNTKLIRKTLQHSHELGEMTLAGTEFASAGKVCAVEGGGTVDDEESKAGFGHHGGGLVEELELVVRVVGAGVGNVVEDFFAVEAVAVGNGEEAHGAEGAFGVDVETFSFAAAHVKGELAGYGKGVAYLGFAGAELAKDFGDGAGFNAASEKGIEVFGAGRERD